MCRKQGSHARIADLLPGIAGIAWFLWYQQQFGAIHASIQFCQRFKSFWLCIGSNRATQIGNHTIPTSIRENYYRPLAGKCVNDVEVL